MNKIKKPLLGFASFITLAFYFQNCAQGFHVSVDEMQQLDEQIEKYNYSVSESTSNGKEISGAISTNQPVVTQTLSALIAPSSSLAPEFQSGATLLNNGPSNNRVDLIFLGEGFSEREMSNYTYDVERLTGAIFTYAPFSQYKTYFNVHRLDLVSPQSGVSGPNQVVSNVFNSYVGCNNIDRKICSDINKVVRYSDLAPGNDNRIVLLNTGVHAGTGYYSGTAFVAVGSAYAPIMVVHEMGHTLAKVTDEYVDTWDEPFTGQEPAYPNASIYNKYAMLSRRTKWFRWFGEWDVDTFEGAYYQQKGVYRPTENSIMNTLTGANYGPVNTEAMIVRIYRDFVRPIDDYSPKETNFLVNNSSAQIFSVKPMRPVSHALETLWYFNDQLISQASSVDLNFLKLSGMKWGSNKLVAKVTDRTSLVRDETARERYMSQTIQWNVQLVNQDLSNRAPAEIEFNMQPKELYAGEPLSVHWRTKNAVRTKAITRIIDGECKWKENYSAGVNWVPWILGGPAMIDYVWVAPTDPMYSLKGCEFKYCVRAFTDGEDAEVPTEDTWPHTACQNFIGR